MNLSEISIRRPVFAWMIMAAILVFGIISFRHLGISNLPDVDFPVISVSLSLNGAAPEVMEAQVLDPIEDSLMQIDGIRSISSHAMQSSGSISIEFELDRNINSAMEQVQAHINQVRNLLPIDLFPPILKKSNPEDQPILWLVLTTTDPKTPIADVMSYARNFLFDQFAVVEGVGNIVLGGYVDPALRVWTDLTKLKKYDLTAQDLVRAIQQEHVEVPAGLLQNNKHTYTVRVLGEASDPTEFGKIAIHSRENGGPNYRPIQLRQVARVEEGLRDVRKISRLNGKRAVGLGIVKQHGSNSVEVARMVKERLKELQAQIPKHFNLEVRTDNTRFVKQSVDELVFTLGVSALLTAIVCYLFLGS